MPDSEGLVEAVDRCAYCHDQCLAGTPELLATRNQSAAVSRVAIALRTRRLDGRPWDAGLAERVFLGLNDGLQFESCIYRREGHRIEPYIRAARAEVIAAGLAPPSVARVQDMLGATGNVFGLVEVVGEPLVSVPGTPILVHDAASRALNPAGLRAARELLRRVDGRLSELPVASCGAVEADLGLVDHARRAAGLMLAALDGLPPGPVVTTDATVALTILAAERSLGRPVNRSVAHLSQYLAGHPALPRPGRPVEIQVAYHDSGPLARGLGLTAEPRALLAAVVGGGLRDAVPTGRRASSDGPLAGYPRPDVALTMARARLAELAETGAEAIVTAGPYSLRNLRAADPGLPVVDLWSFLAAGWSTEPDFALAGLLASSRSAIEGV